MNCSLSLVALLILALSSPAAAQVGVRVSGPLPMGADGGSVEDFWLESLPTWMGLQVGDQFFAGPADASAPFEPRLTLVPRLVVRGIDPVGGHLYYTRFVGATGHRFYALPLAGGPPREMLPCDFQDDAQLMLSPDRQVVAVDGPFSCHFGVMVGPADASTMAVPILVPEHTFGGQYDLVGFTEDSSHIVFTGRNSFGANRPTELYIAPIDGSSPALKLSGPPLGDSVVDHVVIGSSHVVYRTNSVNLFNAEMFSVPLDASTAPVRLHPPLSGVMNAGEARIARNTVIFSGRIDSLRWELYGTAVDGSGPLHNLSGTSPVGGNVEEFELNSDGSLAVYRGDLETLHRQELWVVPTDGSGAPVKRSATLQAMGNVDRFVLAPTDDSLVYRADQDTDEVFELFRVPLDGSSPVARVNAALAPGASVEDFQLQNVSSRVVYHDGTTVSSAPLAGGGATRTLSGPIAFGGPSDLAVSEDVVVYRAQGIEEDKFELYSRRDADSTSLERLNADLVPRPILGDVQQACLSRDGRFGAYVANQDDVERNELYCVDLAGSLGITKLSNHDHDEVLDLIIDPAGSRVFFLARLSADGRVGIFSVPPMGGTPLELTDPALETETPEAWRFTPDGSRLVFLQGLHLYSAPVDGSSPPIRLSPTTSIGNGIVPSYAIEANSNRVLFVTDVDGTGEGLYITPVDGSQPATLLHMASAGSSAFQPQPMISPDGNWVLFRRRDGNQQDLLLSMPADGSGPLIQLNVPISTNSNVPVPRISPDSSRVLFRAREEHPARLDLFSIPIDGSAGPLKINAELSPGENIHNFRFTPAGDYVLYAATAGPGFHFWTVPSLGGPATRITGPPVMTATNPWLPAMFIAGGRVFWQASYIVSPTLTQAFQSHPIQGGGPTVLFEENTAERLLGYDATQVPGTRLLMWRTNSFNHKKVVSISMGGQTGLREHSEGSTTWFEVSEDLDLLYIADQDAAGAFELYHTKIDPASKERGAPRPSSLEELRLDR